MIGRVRHRIRAVLAENEFLRHVLTLLTGTVAAQLVVVLMQPVLTRIYGPEAFGGFILFQALFTMLASVAALRYDMAIMLPRNDADAKLLVRAVTLLISAFTVVTTVVCLLVAGPIARLMNSPELEPWLFLLGPAAMASAGIQALSFWLNRVKDYKSISTNRVQQNTASSVGQLVFGLLHVTSAAGLILGQLAGLFLSTITLFRKSRESRKPSDGATGSMWHILKRHWRMPVLNAPKSLVDNIRLTGLVLIIGMLYSDAAQGHFGVAWRILQLPVSLINQAISQVYFQKLSTAAPGTLHKFVQKAIKRSVIIGVLPFVLIFALSPALFPWVLGGSEWNDVGLIAQALVPWLFMMIVSSPISTVFIVTDNQLMLLVHSIFYAAAPMLVMYATRGDIVSSMYWVGATGAVALAILTALALVVSRRYDARAPQDEIAPEVS